MFIKHHIGQFDRIMCKIQTKLQDTYNICLWRVDNRVCTVGVQVHRVITAIVQEMCQTFTGYEHSKYRMHTTYIYTERVPHSQCMLFI